MAFRGLVALVKVERSDVVVSRRSVVRLVKDIGKSKP